MAKKEQKNKNVFRKGSPEKIEGDIPTLHIPVGEEERVEKKVLRAKPYLCTTRN